MKHGHFGVHGGMYIPETLMNAVIDLENAYNRLKNDKEFNNELNDLLNNYANRPSPLYFAKNMTEKLGGAKIYLKREDLNHTGSHKINNVLGQALLAKKMGKKRVIAETGAGQHGLATAAACAKLGMECVVFMGARDVKRQFPNVFNMELLGAKVVSVESGSQTLKDAVNEALREWSKESKNTFYVLGSALGPYPYPDIVREFQSVISKELKAQTKAFFEGNPDIMIACVGGGSNALGFFHHYLKDSVRLIGVEAGGLGEGIGENATRMGNENANLCIAQGYKSYFLSDEYGNLLETHSISAGLDYA